MDETKEQKQTRIIRPNIAEVQFLASSIEFWLAVKEIVSMVMGYSGMGFCVCHGLWSHKECQRFPDSDRLDIPVTRRCGCCDLLNCATMCTRHSGSDCTEPLCNLLLKSEIFGRTQRRFPPIIDFNLCFCGTLLNEKFELRISCGDVARCGRHGSVCKEPECRCIYCDQCLSRHENGMCIGSYLAFCSRKCHEAANCRCFRCVTCQDKLVIVPHFCSVCQSTNCANEDCKCEWCSLPMETDQNYELCESSIAFPLKHQEIRALASSASSYRSSFARARREQCATCFANRPKKQEMKKYGKMKHKRRASPLLLLAPDDKKQKL